MTAIAKKLDEKLTRWAPETAKKVEQLVAEIIDLADHDALDLARSREVEQEVLDIIDEPKAGRSLACGPGSSRKDSSCYYSFPR